MSERTETWTDDCVRYALIEYDERGVCEVTREVMHALLERAGYMQAMPPETPMPTDGLARLRAANDAALRPTATEPEPPQHETTSAPNEEGTDA